MQYCVLILFLMNKVLNHINQLSLRWIIKVRSLNLFYCYRYAIILLLMPFRNENNLVNDRETIDTTYTHGCETGSWYPINPLKFTLKRHRWGCSILGAW